VSTEIGADEADHADALVLPAPPQPTTGRQAQPGPAIVCRPGPQASRGADLDILVGTEAPDNL
jgi:hypothetical protein